MTYAQATFLLSLFGPPLLYLTGYGIYRWAWGNGWDSHERYMSSEAAKVLREERLKDSGAGLGGASSQTVDAGALWGTEGGPASEHSLYDDLGAEVAGGVSAGDQSGSVTSVDLTQLPLRPDGNRSSAPNLPYDGEPDFTLPQPQFKLGLPLALDLGIVAAVADDPTLSAHYGIQAEMLARSVRKVASRG